jgi:hypothetical protein
MILQFFDPDFWGATSRLEAAIGYPPYMMKKEIKVSNKKCNPIDVHTF